MLYEVALIQKPTPKEAEEGKQETLILAPTAVVAANEKSAIATAVANHTKGVDLSRVEVLVRPFA